MIRSLASLAFYARFLRAFSVLGFRRAASGWGEFEPDFSGQTWLITGATGGIGRAIALAANRHGARVLAVARSHEKLAALKDDATNRQRLVPVCSDLSLMTSVRRLAESRAVVAKPIDVLVNNVGVLLNAHRLTGEGLEASFASNLLGPFILAEALKKAGRLAADGIVINVSSGGMYGTPLRLAEMNSLDARRFDGMAAYAMHKRAMVELTRCWNQRWDGAPVVQVMHPGWVDTAGVQSALPGFRRALKSLLRDAEQGADTVLWLAAQRPPPPAHGGIWLDRSLQPEHEFSWTRRASPSAADLHAYLSEQAAKRP